MSSVDKGTRAERSSVLRRTRYNPPGLTELSYRGGEYADAVTRMLARLASHRALARLNREAAEDWSIGLLHAGAVVTDILGFYQARITNEGYLGTSTDRRSVLELARAIGYELDPGAAASAELVVTVSPDDEGQPQSIEIPAGSAVQSTPGEGELPQVFETSRKSTVRTEWNRRKPYVSLRPTVPALLQPLRTDATSIRIAGYRTDLAADDFILVVDTTIQESAVGELAPALSMQRDAGNGVDQPTQPVDPAPDAPPDGEPDLLPAAWILGTILDVVNDSQKPYTDITWKTEHTAGVEIQRPALYVFRGQASLYPYPQGAVYFDPEEAPPETPDDGTKGAETDGESGLGCTSAQEGDGGSATNDDDSVHIVAPSSPAPEDGVVTAESDSDHTAVDPTEDGDDGTTPLPEVVQRPAAWTPETLGLPHEDINVLVEDDDGVLYVGTKRDVFRKRVEDPVWEKAGVDLIPRDVTALALSDDGLLFAGSSTGGIYLSFDGADNWTPVSGDSVAPDSSVEKKNNVFTVNFSATLPKVPVNILETFRRGDDLELYAATAKGVFVSTDEGKTWREKQDNDGLMLREATTAGVSAEEIVDAITPDQLEETKNLAGQFTAALKGGWEKLGDAGSALKFAGADLGDFAMTRVRAKPTEAPINAMAVDKQGKKPTVYVGTESGKYRLKEPLNRWLVVAAIILLVLVAQFLVNRTAVEFAAATMQGTGEFEISGYPGELSGQQSEFFFDGAIRFDPRVPFPPTSTVAITMPLTGQFLDVSPDSSTKQMVLAGSVSGKDTAVVTPLKGDPEAVADGPPSQSYTASISGRATLTRTFSPALTTTFTLPAQARVDFTVTGRTVVTDGTSALLPLRGIHWQSPNLDIQQGTIVVGAPRTPEETIPKRMDGWPQWIKTIWTSGAALVMGALDFLQVFLDALVGAIDLIVPQWIQEPLTALFDVIRNIVMLPINFVNVYLIQPLMSETAPTLATSALVALLVVAIILIWQYIARQMSNRKAVRIGAPVNVLVVRENGQIFAGTEIGVFRSDEGDPNAGLLTRAARVILRRVFPDAKMEPINNGLPVNDEGQGPDVRTMVSNHTGDLLIGTADGNLYRSSTNGDLWYAYETGAALTSSSALLVTRSGQLAAGGVAKEEIERHWFPTHLADKRIDLDQLYPELRKETWLVLDQTLDDDSAQPERRLTLYPILDVRATRSQEFEGTAMMTSVTVDRRQALAGYDRVETMAWLRSEQIALYDNRPVEGDRFVLDGYVPDLEAGHTLIVSGQPLRALVMQVPENPLVSDDGLEERQLEVDEIVYVLKAPDTVVGDDGQPRIRWRLRRRSGFVGTILASYPEILRIAPADADPVISESVQVILAVPEERKTLIVAREPLVNSFDRATVAVYGNVVAATHGRTVTEEILGGGSGRRANERLVLPEAPLTFVRDDSARGVAAELDIAINGIKWAEVPTLYGLTPNARAYIVRQSADGVASVIFGDGVSGARLPSGVEHVEASYRLGIGPVGNVSANSIDQLQTFPDAVRTVVNPMPAAGGVGPEPTLRARERAPLSVRPMARIVSLADYEDFARVFAGVGRALVTPIGQGRKRTLHLTIADTEGNAVPTGSELPQALLRAIDAHRATPLPQVLIHSYVPVFFNILATLVIPRDRAARAREIEAQARQRLRDRYAFINREFGQPVAESGVVSVLHARDDDVLAVEAMRLWLHGMPIPTGENDANELLCAGETRVDRAGQLKPAEMLLLNPTRDGVHLRVVAADDPHTVLYKSGAPV